MLSEVSTKCAKPPTCCDIEVYESKVLVLIMVTTCVPRESVHGVSEERKNTALLTHTCMVATLRSPLGSAVKTKDEREMAPKRTIRQVESIAETLLIREYTVCMLFEDISRI